MVFLIVFTAVVGMLLATPGSAARSALVFGTLGIGLAASAAAAINHVLDRRFDLQMSRTALPADSHWDTFQSVARLCMPACSRCCLSLSWSAWSIWLTAILTFFSLIGYAIIYTLWLKHATPQNIVIGGAAGAAPPVLGWVAVTNSVDPYSLLLFLIIFTWTPPHFWALAIARRDEYAKAGIPMLPVRLQR